MRARKPTRPAGSAWASSRSLGRPFNIAHRGASHAAPPNTLAAFRLAAAMGADGIELDVHLSGDGVPVVIHDFSVDRTTDGTGTVASLTLTQLKGLDAGSSFGRAFAGEQIPTLREVLEAAGDRLLINVELKRSGMRATGLCEAVVGLVKNYGLGHRCLISSFNPFALRRAKRLAPEIAAGLLYAPDLPLPLRRAWLAPVSAHEAVHPEHTMVDKQYVAWARRKGYQVNTWTVDAVDEMRRLVALDVDAIITNRPDVLAEELHLEGSQELDTEPRRCTATTFLHHKSTWLARHQGTASALFTSSWS